jgi:hypothetical protein
MIENVENSNEAQKPELGISDVMNSICPNCNIEMFKHILIDRQTIIGQLNTEFGKPTETFQYSCKECGHYSYKYCSCYIMHRTTDDLIFVTTDKDYAEKLYSSGDYIMRISRLFNPC